MALQCWSLAVSRDDDGTIRVGIYEELDAGQLAFVDAAEFGPVDTAHEIVRWLTRRLSPALHRPLR